MIENRKAYRFPFRAKFVVADATKVITGNTVNLSLGGVYVTTMEPFSRSTSLKCLFKLTDEDAPAFTQVTVKRVVVPSEHVEDLPGLALKFVESDTKTLERVKNFLENTRRNYEMASAILASGEPDLSSIKPLLKQMHVPEFFDLGALRFYIERILRSIELIDQRNAPSDQDS